MGSPIIFWGKKRKKSQQISTQKIFLSRNRKNKETEIFFFIAA
jgi:hypothetical protein